jgi:hypothetical protein
MNYLDLTGPKSVPGSIHNWVNYRKTPIEVILDEAQALIYSRLRVREMRAASTVRLPQHAFTAPVPAQFLEPISLWDRIDHFELLPHRYVFDRGMLERRIFDGDATTELFANITATATVIAVTGFKHFPTSGNFSVLVDQEAMLVTAGHATTSWTVQRGFGGTIAASHSAGARVDASLLSSTPGNVALYDELFQFDCKADEPRVYDLVFYRTPDLLSPTVQSNFLTRRWPHLVRKSTQAAAADFSKDAEEYARLGAELYALIDAANAESDMSMAV